MYKITVSKHENELEKDLIRHIGVCGLTSIDMTNRRAEFSLYLIPSYQGKHLGSKALTILLEHAFNNLGLMQVWGEVFEGNPAIESFEKLGFKRDGVRRDFYFRDGKFINANLISIKDDEWRSLKSS